MNGSDDLVKKKFKDFNKSEKTLRDLKKEAEKNKWNLIYIDSRENYAEILHD